MVDVVIPVYEPTEQFYETIERLCRQTVRPDKIIIMYTISGINERETELFKSSVAEIICRNDCEDTTLEVYAVDKKDFGHGKTRNQGVMKGNSPYVLLMTDDALPADKFLIQHMLEKFEGNDRSHGELSQVYARQTTTKKAKTYLKLTQKYNYPLETIYKTKEDYPTMGIKTIFCSDVCCMYRRDIWEYIGGFEEVDFNEDMIFARRAIDAGYTVCYAADAVVIHFHDYNCRQQFKRNYEIARSQKQNPDVFEGLSSSKEGMKMVKYVLKVLLARGHVLQFFYYIVWTGFKFAGYRVGKRSKKLNN